MKIEERQAMTKAAADYAEAVGIVDLPPSVVLLLCVATYSIPRALSDDGKIMIAKRTEQLRNLFKPKQSEGPRAA